MTLVEVLQERYPAAVPFVDYWLLDDGSGPYIAIWNLDTPRPTRTQLLALGVIEGRKTMSAVKEWAELNRKLLDQAQDIIDATARPTRLGQANDIPALIAATKDGEDVGDSGWTKARAQAVNAMWGSFGIWLNTPLEGVGLSPLQVLSQRD